MLETSFSVAHFEREPPPCPGQSAKKLRWNISLGCVWQEKWEASHPTKPNCSGLLSPFSNRKRLLKIYGIVLQSCAVSADLLEVEIEPGGGYDKIVLLRECEQQRLCLAASKVRVKL